MRRRLWFAIAAVLVLAGCTRTGGDEAWDDGLPEGPRLASRPVVVALLDSGISPYHADFRWEGDDLPVPFLPAGAQLIQLTFGKTQEDSVSSDGEFWENLEEGVLYAFEGTRVLAVTLSHDPKGPRLLDEEGHGTAVASLVARGNPEAVILMIQINGRWCDMAVPPGDCPVFLPVAEALRWAANQPWVDVISLSAGLPGNPPTSSRMDPEVQEMLDAVSAAHAAGKLVVNGAGNTVTPTLASYYSGPPGFITVGGVEAVANGDSISASRGVDVAANFTTEVADDDEMNESHPDRGTSFASPVVAATLSKAIQQVRSTLGSSASLERAPGLVAAGTLDGAEVAFTIRDFRDALNASALPLPAQAWNPLAYSDPADAADSASAPVLAPGPQGGWGHVHAGLAEEIARRVLESDLEPPPDKALTALYQAQWQAAREEYWSRFGG